MAKPGGLSRFKQPKLKCSAVYLLHDSIPCNSPLPCNSKLNATPSPFLRLLALKRLPPLLPHTLCRTRQDVIIQSIYYFAFSNLPVINPQILPTLDSLSHCGCLHSTQNSSLLTLGCPASQGWKCPNSASPEAAAAPKHSWGKEGRQQLRVSPAPCLWSQNRPKDFINSRAQDTSTGIGVLPVVSTQGGRHAKPAGICKAFQGLKSPVVMLPSCESMHLLHTSPQTTYIKLFSSWLEETRSLEVLRAGSFPLLPGKRNSPAEKQVSPGRTTRTMFAGMQKPHGPQFATTDVRSDSLPSSAHPSQAQKDAAGNEALPKRRPSCNTFSICLPHTLPFFPPLFPPAGYKAEAAATC